MGSGFSVVPPQKCDSLKKSQNRGQVSWLVVPAMGQAPKTHNPTFPKNWTQN